MVARRRVYSCAQPVFQFLPPHPAQGLAFVPKIVPDFQGQAKALGQG